MAGKLAALVLLLGALALLAIEAARRAAAGAGR